MTISFPTSPVNGQLYSPGAPACDYVYNSTYGVWQNNGPAGGLRSALLTGLTPLAGTLSATDTVLSGIDKLQTQSNVLAPLASPALTGIPVVPTATAGTNTTQIASTAFLSTAQTNTLASALPLVDGVAAIGTSSRQARQDHVHPVDWGANSGRNKLHNPLFTVVQRGTGPFTTSTYTLDRWLLTLSTDTNSVSQVALSDANRTSIGDEDALYALQNTFTGSTGFSYIAQRMENVRRLSGKTVTVSLWAKAASGTPKLGFNILQYYGTGGSPSGGSPFWNLATGSAVTISTTWTRYSVTLNVTSASGITLGTNNDHYTQLGIFYSSGTSTNAIAGNIGVQSGTIQIWGVQLEVGSIATALEKPGSKSDLSNCQRFYQASVANGSGAGVGELYATAGSLNNFFPIGFPQMRATPTVVWTVTLGSNYSSYSTYLQTQNGSTLTLISSAAGSVIFWYSYTANADL